MSVPTATLTTITTQLVTAFEAAWRAIQQRHSDVPDVVVTFGSGTLGMKGGATRLGHFAAARWQHGDQQLPELFISGEGLQRGALEVLGTLLHEAAHGLAHVREVKETSRQGRYHNAKFRALGEELGLTLAEDKTIGWSLTTVPETTAKAYAAELDELGAALVAWRYAEVSATTKKKSTNLAVAECACPRKIRVARTTLAEAPITCGNCGVDFMAEDDEE